MTKIKMRKLQRKINRKKIFVKNIYKSTMEIV